MQFHLTSDDINDVQDTTVNGNSARIKCYIVHPASNSQLLLDIRT
ncbi:hypothetical protein [Psychrobacter sp.]